MSDPFSINGGSIVALAGKDCVGIACDLRLGQQAMTISTDFPKIFPMGDKVFLGLSGLATDVQTLYSPSSTLTNYRNERFRFKVNMYKLREERPIEPKTLAHLVSSTLYEKRFGPYFISPIVAGLNSKTNEPYICGFDNIGYHYLKVNTTNLLDVSTYLHRLLLQELRRSNCMECWKRFMNRIWVLSNCLRR